MSALILPQRASDRQMIEKEPEMRRGGGGGGGGVGVGREVLLLVTGMASGAEDRTRAPVRRAEVTGEAGVSLTTSLEKTLFFSSSSFFFSARR